MAYILAFPISFRSRPGRPPADTLAAGSGVLLESLLDGLRGAWWDGSSLGLSRAGLEALVGLEPGDATPRRRFHA